MIPTSMPVIFIDTAIKVLLLLVLASVLVFLCRRCSAATRHWIWSLSLGSTLALPVLSIFLPAIDLEVLAGAANPDRGRGIIHGGPSAARDSCRACGGCARSVEHPG